MGLGLFYVCLHGWPVARCSQPPLLIFLSGCLLFPRIWTSFSGPLALELAHWHLAPGGFAGLAWFGLLLNTPPPSLPR
ncbi:hypothetical protein BDW66DRAFT_127493 [Aspergillus desertorum]